MKKNASMILTIAGVLIVGGSSLAYLVSRGEDDQTETATSNSSQSSATDKQTVPATNESQEESSVDHQATGSYETYSDAAFTAASDEKRVLFFHSKTCVVCDQIDRNISAGQVTDGIAIFKVPMEEETDLVEKYDVNLQTTFILVDEEGEQIKSWNWLSKPFSGAKEIAEEVSNA